jgi:hypothetical protein
MSLRPGKTDALKFVADSKDSDNSWVGDIAVYCDDIWLIGATERQLPATRIVLQAALPPFLWHAERKVLRALPCRPLAAAWSEHAFETAFLAPEAGLATEAGCAAAALESIRTTRADNIKVFENPFATSLNADTWRRPIRAA